MAKIEPIGKGNTFRKGIPFNQIYVYPRRKKIRVIRFRDRVSIELDNIKYAQSNLRNSIIGLRKRRELEQSELAERVGQTKEVISNIEEGLEMPCADLLISIAKALDYPVDDFLKPYTYEHIWWKDKSCRDCYEGR